MQDDELVSQDELDKLLAGLVEGVGGPRTSVSQFDFHEMVLLSPQDLHAVEDCFEQAFGAVARSLSYFIGRSVMISLRGLEQTRCADFLANLPDPPIVAVLSCGATSTHFLWAVDPPVAYAMLDCATGGEGNVSAPTRPASEIELAVLSRLVQEGVAGMTSAWPELGGQAVDVQGVRASAAAVDLIPRQEPVLVSQMTARLGDVDGAMGICLPTAVVREMLRARAGQRAMMTEGQSPKRALRRVRLRMIARLGQRCVRLSDVARLRPGAVIALDQPLNEPIELLVADMPKLRASVGVSRGRLAVQVTGRASVREACADGS
ncbi:MAG: flagellar motor switch protein FliM [Armatimonadota bacterium]